PCCSVMTSVASPPRRPSTLAMRSLCPVQVPTSEGSSAQKAGAETRVAAVNEWIRAFIYEPLGWGRIFHPTNCYSFVDQYGRSVVGSIILRTSVTFVAGKPLISP